MLLKKILAEIAHCQRLKLQHQENIQIVLFQNYMSQRLSEYDLKLPKFFFLNIGLAQYTQKWLNIK